MLQFSSDVSDNWKKIRNEERINWMSLTYKGTSEIIVRKHGQSSFEEAAKELVNEIVFLFFRGYHVKGKIRPLDILILWIPDSEIAFKRARALHHVEQIVNHCDLSEFLLLHQLTQPDLTNSGLAAVIERVFGTGKEHIILNKSISDIHRERFIAKMGTRKSQSKSVNEIYTKIYTFIKEFIRIMELFWKMYVQPMNSVNAEYHQTLFAQVFNVMDTEKSFFKDISRYFPQNEGTNYDELFQKIVFHCNTYKEFFTYADNYPSLVKGGKDLSSYPQFISMNRKMESELQQKNEKTCKNIWDFLRYPLSHVPGFQVLAEELLAFTPKENENYIKLEIAVRDLSETSVYVDLKDEEIELQSKSVELSNRFKINELREEKKRSMISFHSIRYKKERGEAVLFTDCLLLHNASAKMPHIYDLAKPGFGVRVSEKDEKFCLLEMAKKKLEVDLYDNSHVVRFVDLVESTRDALLRQISVERGYKTRIIFQSWLEKEGGGKFSYNLKQRWHVLTADHKMTYFEKPDGKVKGQYSVQAVTVGKGRPSKGGKRKKGLGAVLGRKKKKKKKKPEEVEGEPAFDCWMYIETDERVYGMIAPDPLLLDTWVRILEATGCYRKDILDEKEKAWHDAQIGMILQAEEGDPFADPDDEETEGEGDKT